ncbi:MAG: beta strand repeat-containing protein [Planctomycetaceae bacterium]
MLRGNWLKWFERRIQLGRRFRAGRSFSRVRFAAKRSPTNAAWVSEVLEARTLLTTYTVDNLVDESDGDFNAGDLSLREAIELANASAGADDIKFADGLGGAVFNLTLGPLTVTDSVAITGFASPVIVRGSGFVLQQSGPGNLLTFSMTGVGVNGTTAGPGLLIDSTNDAMVNATISNSFFHNAATQGIKISAQTGGEARLTANNVQVNSNGDVTLSAGIFVDVGVAAAALSPNTPGKFAVARLNLSNAMVKNNPLEGLKVVTGTGGDFETPSPITNTTFMTNGFGSSRNQIDGNAAGPGSSILARFSGVNADGAAATGFNFVGTAGANVAVVIQNSSAQNAKSDAFALRADGLGTSAALTMDGFNGSNAASSGAEFNVTNKAQVRVNSFNNITMLNSGGPGVDVNMIVGDITAFNGSAVNVSGSKQSGLDLFLRTGVANFNITGLTANNNGERGVQITSIVGALTDIVLNNLSAQGNKLQPLNVLGITNTTLNLDVNGGTVTSAGSDPATSIFASIDNNAVGNLAFDGLNVNGSTGVGISARYDRNSRGNLEITNTNAMNARSAGLALFSLGGSQITSTINGLNVSGAGAAQSADGVRVDVVGPTSKADLNFSNLTANNASARGIALLYANGATGAVTQFNNVSAQNARQDGLFIDVRGGSKLTAFNANGVNVSGAGTSGSTTHDGLDLTVQSTGSNGVFNIQNLTANNARGRGVNLNLQNVGVAQIVIDGFSANNNGLEGVNAAVGTALPGARLNNSALRNGTANNNGTVMMSDGIRTRVTGASSIANLTLNKVSANSNTRSGHDVLVDNAGNLTLQIDNGSTANSNFLNGLRFVATGVTTRAAMTSLIGGNTFNDNNDNGLFVQLTNGVQVSDLTVRGGASLNRENGAVIDADDDTGVTIKNFLIAGPGSSFSNNDETGLIVDMHGVLGLGTFGLSNVTASNNLAGATGINVAIEHMTLNDIAITGVSTQNNNGDGLTVLLDEVTVNNNVAVTGFNSGGNAGDGVELNLIHATAIAGTMSVNGTASGNMGDGTKILANDGTGVSVGSFAITGGALSVNGNMGNGMTVDFDNVAGITAFDLSGMVITNNKGDQVSARFANMPAPLAISFNDATATGPGAGMGTGDGIDLTIDNTTASSLNLNRISATNNGGDGLKLNLLNGAVIPATSIDVGTFNNNGANGIGINITGSTASIDITNSTFVLLGTVASASGNGNDGVRVRLDNANLTMNTIDHINFDNNGRIGFNVEGATPSNYTSAGSFTNNTVNNNGSFGWRGVFNGGNFDISIGSSTTAGQGNVFNNNRGAGISLDMIQNSIGHMVIVDNTITNTRNDNDPTTQFTGEGIFVRMLGTSNPAQATNTLTSGMGPGLLIRNNRIGVTATDVAAGNAGTGVNFQVEERSVITGLHVHDNRVDNSGGDGLNFVRLDEVVVNDFQVLRNTFNDGGDDGVEILAQNDDSSSMDVNLSMNEMMRNGNDGVAMGVNADAGLNINMDDNMIVQNADDGFEMTEVILDLSDNRRITGNAERNVIAENGNRGVAGNGRTVGLTFNDNTVGMLRDEFDQIVYLGNGSTGVELNASGSSIWDGNDVRANGRLVTADRTRGHGFDIQGAGSKDVTMRDNQIRENFQDGIEFLNIQDGRFIFTLTMIDNRVQNNLGRGLDVLNQAFSTGVAPFPDARSFITIFRSTTGNTFNSNGEEGVYAVNTSSPTQNQTDFSGTTLLQDGTVERDPQLSLIIDHATISNNGSPANVPNMIASAGVLVRVGTSDGRGGLTSSTANQPIQDQFATFDFSYAGDVAGALAPGFRQGGVFLGLTSSSLHGNFGDDVFIHGYRSTGDPPAVAGTWSDTMFDITNTTVYGDPLSRIDVEWRSNDFDSVDLNNDLRRGTPDGQAGAFYNNADGTFKSRIAMSMPPGPFANNAAGRRRNAQRVPARLYEGGFSLAPSVGLSLSSGDTYGSSTASLGDINGDGIADVAIGTPGDNTLGTDRGAVYIQFLNADGTINSTTKIASSLAGGPALADNDRFGSSLTSVGDLDGDGIGDLAVGASGDDTGGADRGAVYILFLNPDGTVKSSTKIASGTMNGPTLADGDAFGSSLSAPSGTTGSTQIAVGAVGDDTGGANRGAIHVLNLNTVGTVAMGTTKIASGTGGGPALADGDLFGSSVAAIGDLNGDTFMDWAVGAIGDDSGGTDQGAVYILFMNAMGTVGSFQEISEGNGDGPALFPSDFFGSTVTTLSDLDMDGVDELVVGAPGINVGGSNRGAFFVLLMETDGTVKDMMGIVRSADGDPNVPMLANDDQFGSAVTNIGDLDGDGVDDLAVGARGDDTQANNGGAAYIVLMNADGTIKSTTKIGSGAAGTATADGGTFLYPGMGESTFRVTGAPFGAGFILDDSPFVSQFSANGIGFTAPGLSGELPFGWGTY